MDAARATLPTCDRFHCNASSQSSPPKRCSSSSSRIVRIRSRHRDLIKATLIKRNSPQPTDLPQLLGGGHNLAALAERAVIEISPEERDLLRRLAKFVEWAGRYPVPLKVSQMVVEQTAVSIRSKVVDAVTGETEETEYSFLPLPMQLHERVIFDRLFERVESQILS